MLAWGNRHFAPEGASIVIVDANTGAAADPVLVDRATGRPLDRPRLRAGARPRRHRGRPRPAGRRGTRGSLPPGRRGMSIAIAAAAAPAPLSPHSPRTQPLLHGPIVPTLLRLAWPNVLVMLAQASTGLIETWFVSRLGTDALAGMALVFPGFMMMQMLSGGAMGGGISSAIARALGGRRRDDADALVLHAIIINVRARR